MKAWLAAFSLSIWLGTPAIALAQPAVQPLSINIHGDGARATQLPAYDPATPISVRVKESRGRTIDAVTVVATGPAGETVRSTLSREADGGFGGTLALTEEGDWRVRLTSRTGSTSIDTVPVVLALQSPPPSNAWQIGVGVGSAIFVVVGGTGFLILRRSVSGRPEQQTAQAA